MTENKIRAIIKSNLQLTDDQNTLVLSFLQNEHSNKQIELEWVCDKSILEGFKIELFKSDNKANPEIIYDWTALGRYTQLENKLNNLSYNADDDIILLISSAIDEFVPKATALEMGTVKSVGDSVATISGLDSAMYGEIVVFESGVKGMVQSINKTDVGCILFGSDSKVNYSDKVFRTGKRAGVPVGENFVGRIVNALGEAIDGLGDIEADDYRLIEESAPTITQREPVNKPLKTGILAIDSMFPIGKGQRELIIGDRQTGKTSIAIDTILNQKGKDVICIYNAIGQKASSIAKTVNTLKANGALDYTIVVVSTASDPSSLQYIAPYSATAIAEYFMHQGKDVLIVYDDLSKHAVAYRALSLLLGRSPGREAYPGDVFYLHSRLLERSCNLSESMGGGSITALPIIETQAGDVSAYIPTNVISITDGQIFLESDLFFSGMRPAVNVGLSVSRVGGSAQTKAMKKASGSLRINLAQYKEIEVFSQFQADLDEDTRRQIKYGKGLMEILKQPLLSPLEEIDQVLLLVIATSNTLADVSLADTKDFIKQAIEFIKESDIDIVQTIESEKTLSDELKDRIIKSANIFKDGHYHND